MVFFAWFVQAQSVLVVSDAETGLPVEGAVAFVQSKGRVHSFVTDSSGELQMNASERAVITVRHLYYNTFTDTLQLTARVPIHLVPAKVALNEVVVTGQYQTNSALNSLYRVKTIDTEQIRNQGAISVNEVLATQLNIRLSQDLAVGSTTLSLGGISGQNVKILVDGVPLANRNGNGNDADLSQVNLQTVEKIEIIEGPMAVSYGANALAGVINIITRQTIESKAEIHASIQEESAGNKYGLNEGRHNQSAGLSYHLSSRWFVQGDISRNSFLGYNDNRSGAADEWNPKDQWIISSLLRTRFGRHSLTSKLDYLDELITDKGVLRTGGYAFDETYSTQRLGHLLQADGSLDKLSYNAIVSYSDFERIKRRFSKNLNTGEEVNTSADGDQDTSTFNAIVMRGTFMRAINPKLSLQAGYDINLEHMGGGRISGDAQSMADYALFASAEWNVVNKLWGRPGFRYAVNSVYGNAVLPSLNIKYALSDEWMLRAAYGRGYRAPSLRELFFEFVDSNHRIFGNEDLKPEQSHHLDFAATRQWDVDESRLDVTVSGFYNALDNRITFAQSSADATVVTYINELKYRTLGLTIEQVLTTKRISLKTGISVVGRYNQESESINSAKTYFYSPEAMANGTYRMQQPAVSFNLFYKFNGSIPNYILNSDNTLTIGKVASYQWVDASISKTFFGSLDMILGARNLLNVTNLSSSGQSGTHSGGSVQNLSYGRSFFLTLKYTLQLNKEQ